MTAKQKRQRPRERAEDDTTQSAIGIAPDQLLYTRDQLRRILGGISTDTVTRLEAAGRLKPLRLSPARTARVYYRRSDIDALIGAEADA